MKDKRGVLGLETVKAVMLAFLIIGIIAVVMILTFVQTRDVAETIDTKTVNIINLTTATVVNETGAYVSGTSTYRNCALTIDSAINQTASINITSSNYTTSACLVVYTGGGSLFNNTLWNITGSYKYSDPRSYGIQQNVSTGLGSFFSNTNTIFQILVVVVIIMAVAIIILVISRFGGGGTGGRAGGRGADTVMGI